MNLARLKRGKFLKFSYLIEQNRKLKYHDIKALVTGSNWLNFKIVGKSKTIFSPKIAKKSFFFHEMIYKNSNTSLKRINNSKKW
ncbi:hypothetical protein BpHYR1_010693 [Brachionus plicatilis]|uniref:Uncharacterized protein n=1 Tax=Brachionus plicatilis TaxID=10195 RepID=A0A3M7SV57_BRAPC|nr:hypothetical protein BpHYR1_010693 [Brachionus plicatilis]